MTRQIAVSALVLGLSIGLALTPAAQDAAQVVRVPTDAADLPEAIGNVAKGGTVLVAAGTWQANLTIDKSITVRGMGANPSDVEINASTQGCPVALIRSSASRPIDVQLANMTLRGASSGTCRDDLSGATEGDGVGVLGNANVTLSDVVVTGNANDGLHAQDETFVTAINTAFRNNGDAGLLALDEATIDAFRSDFSNNDTQGLGTSSSNPVSVANSTITDNTQNGLIAIFSASVRILDTDLSNNGKHGLLLRGFSTGRVLGATLSGNAGHGVSLEQSATAELYRNTVESNQGSGVLAHREPCVDNFSSDDAFDGSIEGNGNTVANNKEAQVCPDELEFLTETTTFGES
ncbi:MAG: right-handed parallel beta-helix repeat-containing protein [Candidatus Bipolaricaulia bacterium]